MKILFLTQIIPYPPDAGPRVKTLHVLRHLIRRGHEVTLASFIRPEEEPFLPAIEELCGEVHAVPIRRSRLADVGYWLRSHVSGRPFLVERDSLKAMHELVFRLAKLKQVEVIHADQLTMAQFALSTAERLRPDRQPPRLIFDAHNAVWTIVERMRAGAPWYLRPVAALEAARVKRYEGQIAKRFDNTLAVTENDRQALLQALQNASGLPLDASGGNIEVIPIAVDTEGLRPAQRRAGSGNILTLGTLHYPPNADGIRWFLQEVFPLVREAVPHASITIIGKNPPSDFKRAAEENPETIRVTGYVPDLDPYMEAAEIMVVPVRAGGGMRVRILEAFARGMPLVTTTVGLEGIQALDGEAVLVADSPEAFARATVRLLQQPVLQAKLAANGRQLAESHYDWQVVLGKMDELYKPKQVRFPDPS